MKPDYYSNTQPLSAQQHQQQTVEYERSKSYEGVACVCVETKIGTIETQGGKKPVFILELVVNETGEILTKFLNVTKTDKGGYTVKINSNFAKLYRLACGYVKKSRLSKANQLLKHFRNKEFLADYVPAVLNNGTHYLKVIKLKPKNPIEDKRWLNSGYSTEKPLPKKPKIQLQKDGNKLETKWKWNGNEQEKNRKQNGNEKTLETGCLLGMDGNLNPIAKRHITKWNHNSIPSPIKQKPKIRVMNHQQREGESQDAYYDRVIDETFCFEENATNPLVKKNIGHSLINKERL